MIHDDFFRYLFFSFLFIIILLAACGMKSIRKLLGGGEECLQRQGSSSNSQILLNVLFHVIIKWRWKF
jgi:hypothetical protein